MYFLFKQWRIKVNGPFKSGSNTVLGTEDIVQRSRCADVLIESFHYHLKYFDGFVVASLSRQFLPERRYASAMATPRHKELDETQLLSGRPESKTTGNA